MITGAVNHKTLTVPEKYRGRLFVAEQVDGIRVIRCWSYAGFRGSFKKRLLNFLTFAGTAALAGLARAGRADVVYASSTPLTVGIPGWFTAAVRRAPFFFEVRDLWPQSAIVAGVLKEDSRATRLAAGLARFLYRRAVKIVAVTRGIAEGLRREGAIAEKILFVPNGVDDWMVQAGAAPVPQPAEGFRVVYCGAHGHWNGLGQILQAAALLGDETGIEFDFIGDGDEREALVEKAKEMKLSRLTFRGAIPKQVAFEELRRASACIVVTWAHPFQRMVLANKIFDYLAAGRPVIVAAEGEMAQLVQEAGCGLVVPPEAPELLAEAIRRLAAMPEEEREAMGRRGRKFILENYSREDLGDRLLGSFADETGLDPKPADAPGPGPRLVKG